MDQVILIIIQVYTIDTTNKEEILSTVRKALKVTNFSSFLPHEFTQKVVLLFDYSLCSVFKGNDGENRDLYHSPRLL